MSVAIPDLEARYPDFAKSLTNTSMDILGVLNSTQVKVDFAAQIVNYKIYDVRTGSSAIACVCICWGGWGMHPHLLVSSRKTDV